MGSVGAVTNMIGTDNDELEIFSCGPNYMTQMKTVETRGEKTPNNASAELSDIVNIGRKLSNYGTYLCNKRHTSPSRHICSFLVCPGRHSSDPYPPRPSVSLIPADSLDITSCLGYGRNRQARKKRGRVRFSDCFDGSESATDATGRMYALDDDLTAKLSSIRLTKNSDINENKKVFEQRNTDGDMFRGLSEGVGRMDIQDTMS